MFRFFELHGVLDGRHPEAELVGVVMTVAFSAVALDERRRAEIFEAGARTRQGLATALRTRTRVLENLETSVGYRLGVRLEV